MRDLSPASAPVSASRGNRLPGTLQRLLLLALLFGAELPVITVFLDGDSLKQQGGLTGAVRDWGPLILRAIVGFAALFAVVAWLRGKIALARFSERIARTPVRWAFLAAHVAAMAAFGVLAAGLYGGRLSGIAPDLLAGGWLAAGLLGIACAALAFLPWSLWVEMLRATGDAWAYSLSAVLGALLLQQASRALWQPAARLTFAIVKLILGPFVTIVLADPVAMRLRTSHFGVIIAPECSGMEGAGLMIAFGVTILWLFRKECRFPQCLLLIPGGIVLLFLLNAVRIAVLMWIGDAGAQQIAIGGFHSQAGWIAFNSVALGMAIAARRLPWISTRQPVAESLAGAAENPTAAYLMPFLLVLAAGMVSRAASGSFEWPYALRLIAAAAALWHFRKQYAHLDWRFGAPAVAAGALVAVLWVALDRWSNGGAAVAMPAALAAASSPVRIAWVAMRALAAVFIVPVVEELAFRGFLLRRLVSGDFEAVSFQGLHWFALPISSAVFGLLHGHQWFAGTVAGGVYGLVQARRGRIGDAVAAHAVSNGLLAAYVLLFQQWQFW